MIASARPYCFIREPKETNEAKAHRHRQAVIALLADERVRVGYCAALAAGRAFLDAGRYFEAGAILEPLTGALLRWWFMLAVGKSDDLPHAQPTHVLDKLRCANVIDRATYDAAKESLRPAIGTEARAWNLRHMADWAREMIGDALAGQAGQVKPPAAPHEARALKAKGGNAHV